MLIASEARLSRQAQLVHPDLQEAVVLMAGVGMLGGWLALALARCAAHVFVADPDIVEDVNTGNQPYSGGEVGMPKAEAIARLLTGMPVSFRHSPFPLDEAPADILAEVTLPEVEEPRKLIIITAADSFDVRGKMAAYARFHEADLFVDVRAMEDISVVAVVPHSRIKDYLKDKMVRDEEAPDAPCGLRGTAYVGMATAARVVGTLNAVFRGAPASYFNVRDVVLQEELLNERL